MELSEKFALAAASLVGREHVRRNRNNQDAVAIETKGDRLVAVVADGCGEGSRSEVGAALGARFLAGWLLRSDHASSAAWTEAAADALTEYLRGVARGSWGPERERAFVAEHLLFTFLAAVVTPERWLVFGSGDGVVRANESTRAIDSGPDNAPEYLAYRLVGRAVRPVVHAEGATEALRQLVIGTDGVAPLLDGDDAIARLTRDVLASGNPTLLQRGFVVLRDRERRIQDDATAVVIARRSVGVTDSDRGSVHPELVEGASCRRQAGGPRAPQAVHWNPGPSTSLLRRDARGERGR